jgi:hypothetical protein
MPLKYCVVLVAATALLGCGKREGLAPAPQQKSGVSIEEVARSSGDNAGATPASAASPQPPADAAASADLPKGSHPGKPVNPKEVKAAIDKYFERFGNFPNNWQELIKAKMLTTVPVGESSGKPVDFRQCMQYLTQPQ